jgi:hypothetical protein
VSVFKARMGDGTDPAGQQHEGRAHGVGGAAAVSCGSAATRSSEVATRSTPTRWREASGR